MNLYSKLAYRIIQLSFSIAAIGSILKIDCATFIYSRGGFTRICVELDLSKKLIPRILVFGSTFNIEYEDLHLICFNYGKYDHRIELCNKNLVDNSTISKTVEELDGDNPSQNPILNEKNIKNIDTYN
ncbi:hypothetical protein Ahy_A04g018176 [Arachis hypogaea]|uniref:Zinc knuckle CX2CX4HX4C domain-containing protein n=1 Tax=Arachis hypogaea TaxID=3818 RepID=A0A445DD34_ARAHY|nr:hypothetical protein Ahy_A04g018176 [Arachis hypogaea]